MVKAGVTHDFTIADVGNPNTKLGFLRPRRGASSRQRFGVAETIRPRVWQEGQVTEASFPIDVQLLFHQEGWAGGIGGRIARLNPEQIANARYIDTGNREGNAVLAPPIEDTSIGAGVHGIYVPGGIVAWDSSGRPALFTANTANVIYLSRYQFQAWGSTIAGTSEVRTPTIGQIGSPAASDRRIPRNPTYYKGRGYCPVVGLGAQRLSKVFPYLIQDASDINVWEDSAQKGGSSYVAWGHFAIADGKLWGGNRYYWNRDGAGTPIAISPASTQNGAHVISSNTTPASPSAWVTDIEVGLAGSPVTALHGDADNLIICKPEGLFRLGSTGDPVELDQSLRNLWSPNNYLHRRRGGAEGHTAPGQWRLVRARPGHIHSQRY